MTMPTSSGYTLPRLRGVGITAIGRICWLPGLFYYRGDNGYDPQIVNFGGPAINPLKPVTLVQSTTVEETDSAAVYGQGSVDLRFRTKLDVDARYTNEKRSIDGLQIACPSGVVPITLADHAPRRAARRHRRH